MLSRKLTICLVVATLGSAIGASTGSLSNSSLVRRSRRSESEARGDGSREAYSSEDLTGYRFGDEFFNDPSAETAEASEIAGVSKKRVEGCERVVKDSMICMVCKDPKTNSNYEQCSYVARPKDRVRSYSGSRSYERRPEVQARDEATSDEEKPEATSHSRYGDEEKPESYGQNSTEDDEAREGSYAYDKPEIYDDERAYGARESPPSLGRQETRPRATNERQDQRKNRESGESADYDDRVGQSSYETTNRRAPNSPRINSRKKTSEEHPKENKKRAGKCREVQKDSMTCTICTNPENGGNFEKCSYNHQPNDRHYKFTKSKRFGYPHEESATEETKRVSEVVAPAGKLRKPHCRKVRKSATTVCNVCENSTTGERSEHCESGTDPGETSDSRISRTLPRFHL